MDSRFPKRSLKFRLMQQQQYEKKAGEADEDRRWIEGRKERRGKEGLYKAACARRF